VVNIQVQKERSSQRHGILYK